MKKIFIFMFIITLCIFSVGCNHQHNTDMLKFSTWGSQSEIKILKPLLSEFEKKYNAKIELIHIPQNYFQKLHLLFASKQAPDVIFLNNYYLPIYAKAGLLTTLSEFLTPKEKLNYFSNAIDALSVNGNNYAIPRDISNLVIYYNKDLFDKKHLPYPQVNWTYDEFLNTAKELTDEKTFGIGFEEEPLFWEPILWSYGGKLFNSNGELNLNNKESKDALKYYIELRTINKVAPSRLQSANRTMAQMFLDQKIAMQISGRWLVPKYRSEANFDWDIINLPQGKYGSIAGSDASGWAISQSSQNKKLALELIKFLSSRYAINKMTECGLITPARKDVAYSKIYLNSQKPKNANIFLKINDNAMVNEIPENYYKKINELNKILEPYFIGKEKITPSTRFEL